MIALSSAYHEMHAYQRSLELNIVMRFFALEDRHCRKIWISWHVGKCTFSSWSSKMRPSFQTFSKAIKISKTIAAVTYFHLEPVDAYCTTWSSWSVMECSERNQNCSTGGMFLSLMMSTKRKYIIISETSPIDNRRLIGRWSRKFFFWLRCEYHLSIWKISKF